MSKKKELLASIAVTETRIVSNLVKIRGYQGYFRKFCEDHGILLVAMLLPSFLMGWKMAKIAPTGQLLSQFVRFSLITSLNFIRKQSFS